MEGRGHGIKTRYGLVVFAAVVAAFALAMPASASQPMSAKGTETYTANLGPFKFADGNTLLHASNPGEKTGTFTAPNTTLDYTGSYQCDAP